MFFRKKKPAVDEHKIVSSLLSLIINDQVLSNPVYLEEIKTENDGDALGIAPLVYIWNENREAGTFSVSVNGKAVAHLLESFVPRKHKGFTKMRDEAMLALSKTSKETIVSLCGQLGVYPSQLFLPDKRV